MPICEKYGMKLGDAEKDADVICWGFVSEEKKLELLSRTTALVFHLIGKVGESQFPRQHMSAHRVSYI